MTALYCKRYEKIILPDHFSYNTNHSAVQNGAALSKLLFIRDVPALSFHGSYVLACLNLALYKINGKLQTNVVSLVSRRKQKALLFKMPPS